MSRANSPNPPTKVEVDGGINLNKNKHHMDNSNFKPNLTPREMLAKGIFGGSYFGVEKLEGDMYYDELFQSFADIDSSLYLSNKYKPTINKFKVASGKDYKFWNDSNWMHEDDPYGWFEWYCKYYIGRRHSDDQRQIQRWLDFCGPKGRWRQRIYRMIDTTGNWDVSPRIQQSLLHWGYQVNDDDYGVWLNQTKNR